MAEFFKGNSVNFDVLANLLVYPLLVELCFQGLRTDEICGELSSFLQRRRIWPSEYPLIKFFEFLFVRSPNRQSDARILAGVAVRGKDFGNCRVAGLVKWDR